MRWAWFRTATCLALVPATARAGMPSITIADVPRMRLETISFFLVLFLAGAAVVRWIWNGLRRDFPRWPRLSYAKAVGLVGLWGLLFLLVLTMISGARELLTPGAWIKQGLTYALPDPIKTDPPAAADSSLDRDRRLALERLRVLLWSYAEAHDGRFPADRDDPALPESAWRLPDPSGMRFLYVKNRSIEETGEGRLLAFEPAIFPGDRLVLRTNGEIARSPEAELRRAIAAEAPR